MPRSSISNLLNNLSRGIPLSSPFCSADTPGVQYMRAGKIAGLKTRRSAMANTTNTTYRANCRRKSYKQNPLLSYFPDLPCPGWIYITVKPLTIFDNFNFALPNGSRTVPSFCQKFRDELLRWFFLSQYLSFAVQFPDISQWNSGCYDPTYQWLIK